MKRNIYLVLFFLISNDALGQIEPGFALVNDKDGYVNVREKPSIHSKVIKRLNNRELIYVYDEEGQKENWLLADNDGYIYRDRIKWVHSFDSVKKTGESENSISFAGNNISITITSQKFDKRKHNIKYKDSYVYLIDGREPKGIDGYLPTDEYKDFDITIDGKKTIIPKDAYSDLFEPTAWYVNVYYDKENDTVYIVASIGDGAGACEVCWQIEKGVYKRRKTGIPF